MRVVTTGAALSGNKGAASMIEALTRWAASSDDIELTVLTTYPDEDRELAEPFVDVVGLAPIPLVVRDLPVALLTRVAGKRSRRWLTERSPALRALSEADVVADISGVSFSDDRGLSFNVYNAVLAAVPMLIGTPIVKCSQAVGPFGGRVNRFLATTMLPRVRRILSRGALTHRGLVDLGLDNVERADDLAFTLPHDAPVPSDVSRQLDDLNGSGVVVIMPSAVVESWCERHGIDHTQLMARLIERVTDQLGVGVVLVPHAYRASGTPRRMDDARVCRSIAGALGERGDVAVVDRDLSPMELRAIVGAVDMLVASRFHGMITGLATATPTLVIGWGHKYDEVLSEFGIDGSAFDYSALNDLDAVAGRLMSMWGEREQLAGRIEATLPEVVASSHRNFAVLSEVAYRTA